MSINHHLAAYSLIRYFLQVARDDEITALKSVLEYMITDVPRAYRTEYIYFINHMSDKDKTSALTALWRVLVIGRSIPITTRIIHMKDVIPHSFRRLFVRFSSTTKLYMYDTGGMNGCGVCIAARMRQ